MKSHIIFSLFFFLLATALQGQNTQQAAGETMSAKFKVYGNCGMCEKRIEKAAKIDGVISAEWSDETLMLQITFDPKKVKPSQVHQAVAAVGHDTEKVRAEDAVYAKLHGCCQYDRPRQ